MIPSRVTRLHFQGTPIHRTRLQGARCRAGDDHGRIDIGGGDSIRLPRPKKGFRPRVDLTKEQAVLLQLEALRKNGVPYADHGVEVMYRFANIDMFSRSKYFGVMMDLGQFERFRRMMHTPAYEVLIDHTEAEPLSALQVSELVWKQRVKITHKYRLNETAVFEFTMIQKLGGFYDAYFFTDSLVRH